jgi:hypothetical protein
MILTLFYKGYPPMFGFDDFWSINALAAADTPDRPLLKVSAIDGLGAGLNIGVLTDDALGRGRDEGAFSLFLSRLIPNCFKAFANLTALSSFPPPPRLALLPCRWCLRLRVKCAECERLRLIVLLFLRPCPCPRPRRFVMILDILFYILAK